MPVIRIETNIKIDDDNKKIFAQKFSALASEILQKPESVMMINLFDGITLCFAGTHEKAAYIELKSVGLRPENCGMLSSSICAFIMTELGINPERTYIEFKNLDPAMFGWDSKALA